MFTYEIKQTVFRGVLQQTPSQGSPTHLEHAARPHDVPARYWTLSQSCADLRDPENSPSVSMWAYLLASSQTERLNQISIYSARGTTSEQVRFLYMNDCALEIWKQMHKSVTIRGRSHRPPRGAVLSFGMPFAE